MDKGQHGFEPQGQRLAALSSLTSGKEACVLPAPVPGAQNSFGPDRERKAGLSRPQDEALLPQGEDENADSLGFIPCQAYCPLFIDGRDQHEKKYGL